MPLLNALHYLWGLLSSCLKVLLCYPYSSTSFLLANVFISHCFIPFYFEPLWSVCCKQHIVGSCCFVLLFQSVNLLILIGLLSPLTFNKFLIFWCSLSSYFIFTLSGLFLFPLLLPSFNKVLFMIRLPPSISLLIINSFIICLVLL